MDIFKSKRALNLLRTYRVPPIYFKKRDTPRSPLWWFWTTETKDNFQKPRPYWCEQTSQIIGYTLFSAQITRTVVTEIICVSYEKVSMYHALHYGKRGTGVLSLQSINLHSLVSGPTPRERRITRKGYVDESTPSGPPAPRDVFPACVAARVSHGTVLGRPVGTGRVHSGEGQLNFRGRPPWRQCPVRRTSPEVTDPRQHHPALRHDPRGFTCCFSRPSSTPSVSLPFLCEELVHSVKSTQASHETPISKITAKRRQLPETIQSRHKGLLLLDL